MSPIFLILCLGLIVAQFTLPRRYAFAPLLIAVCHFQSVPVIEVGAAFSIGKLVILAGLIRALFEGKLLLSSRQRLDVLVLACMCWGIVSGFFHRGGNYNPMMIRLSLAYDAIGAYLYARSYLGSPSDFLRFVKCLALIAIPLGILVLLEKTMARNLYAIIGSGANHVEIRNERIRAMGPFMHPILTGTFAAAGVFLVVALRRANPRLAVAGAIACLAIVFSAASSGPILAFFSGLFALMLWHFREKVAWIRRAAIFAVVALHLVMQAPVWYLMGRVDVIGGSTGWHRAEIITAALKDIGDWWLVGTDYTRHWVAYGVTWTDDHTDLTNDYLQMAVWGGLPLMLLYLWILVMAFRMIGQRLHDLRRRRDKAEFVVWCVGCSLFVHCVTFFSISYFDQSRIAFWLLIGSLPALCAATVSNRAPWTVAPETAKRLRSVDLQPGVGSQANASLA